MTIFAVVILSPDSVLIRLVEDASPMLIVGRCFFGEELYMQSESRHWSF